MALEYIYEIIRNMSPYQFKDGYVILEVEDVLYYRVMKDMQDISKYWYQDDGLSSVTYESTELQLSSSYGYVRLRRVNTFHGLLYEDAAGVI